MPPAQPAPAAPTAIDVTDLRFGWPSQRPCLEVPALRLARGERVFLHGPSGSGKSTLLGLIAGVLEPQSGSIRVLGEDLGALTRAGRDRLRAAELGFVFQQFNLVPYLPVLENVLLPLRFSPRRRARVPEPRVAALQLLHALGLPQDEFRDRRVTELSVGQQQRVAVARALIGQPQIVIADEPTSSLDADTRRAFLDLLMRECSTHGTALLFVSHDRSLAAHFGRSVALPDINRAARPGAAA